MAAMRSMMARLGLTVNERKTRICRVPGETFRFLGYIVGQCYSPRRRRFYIGMRPSGTAVQRICRAISAMTERRWTDRTEAKAYARLSSPWNCSVSP
jgi:hypothetical protein